MGKLENLAKEIDDSIIEWDRYEDSIEHSPVPAQGPDELRVLEFIDNELDRFGDRVDELLRSPEAVEAIVLTTIDTREFLLGYIDGIDEFSEVLQAIIRTLKTIENHPLA